ncbi:MAG: hypothetical protein QM648_03195 [Solirubrobacterales bacterium]
MQISYDLRAPGRNYQALYDHLKSSYSSWCHPLDSYWFVATNKSAGDVRDECRSYIDSNDKLVSFNVTGDNWGTWNISKDVTDWFNLWL